MGKRQKLAEILLRFPALSSILRFSQPSITVFGFHRIGEATDGDPSLFDCSIAEFEDFISWIAENCPTLSNSELIAITSGGKLPPTSRSIITFDDGYKDNVTAAQILASKGQTGMFFICPEALINRKVGWWERLYYSCFNSPQSSYNFDEQIYSLPDEASLLHTAILKHVKQNNLTRDLQFISQIEEDLQATIPHSHCDKMLMNVANLEELLHLSMDIGSHTQSHRVLSTLNENEQDYELSESKIQLESLIQTSVNSIAYPVGHADAINSLTLEIAKSHGYKIGFTLSASSITENFNQWLQIPRYEAQNSWQLNACTTIIPNLFRKRGQGIWYAK